MLKNTPVPFAPKFYKPFKVANNASDVGAWGGGNIFQEDENSVDHPVVFLFFFYIDLTNTRKYIPQLKKVYSSNSFSSVL